MSCEPSSWPELPACLKPLLHAEEIAQLHQYAKLLQTWNERINLISRRDIERVWEHHLIPSLLLLTWRRFPPGVRVLDIGTGGGLPGLPLAITHPETEFLLLDSTRKKVQAVAAMVAELGLSERCRVQWGRAETLRERFPFIVGRAVAPLPQVLRWVERLLEPQGTFYYYTGQPWPTPPSAWQATWLPFREKMPESPYLASKGILELRRP